MAVSTKLPEVGSTPYFPALTGLRALAAWMVFFYHTNPLPAGSVGWRLLREFNSGVGLFFVLSGLLISARYLGQVGLSSRWLMGYLRRRFARIYPLFFLLTCAVIVVYQLAPAYDGGGRYWPFSPHGRLLLLGLNYTLLRGLFAEFRFTGIMAGWTLTVEETFYVLAPLLLLGLRRWGPRLLAAYAAGLLGLGCALVALPAAWHPYGFFDSYFFMLWGTFCGRCLEFLGGMYLAWRLLARPAAGAASWPVCTCLGLAWWLAGLAAMAVVDAPGPQSATTELTRIILNNAGLVPGFGLLLYGLIREASPLQRLLSSRLFSLLGRASYAFYLIHEGVPQQLLGHYLTQNVLLKFALTNLIAILLYSWIEKPAYRWLIGRRGKPENALLPQVPRPT